MLAGDHWMQKPLRKWTVRLVNSDVLMAIYAAEATIAIGTKISAALAGGLLLIAKIEGMLTC